MDAEVDDPYNDCEWEEVDYEESENADAMPVCASNESRPADPMDEDSDDLQHAITHAANDATPLCFEPNGISREDAMLEDTDPVPIPSRVSSSSRPNVNAETQDCSSSEELPEARTPSPASLPLPEFIGADGPLTPRNDVGPFIFDGSAGLRAAQTRMHSALLAENTPPVREA